MKLLILLLLIIINESFGQDHGSTSENEASNMIEGSDELGYICKREGLFPNEVNCESFYECIWSESESAFRRRSLTCNNYQFFDVKRRKCVDAKKAKTYPTCEYNSRLLDRNNENDWWDYSRSPGIETEDSCIYDLRMHYVFGSPDGVLKRMIGFNGQFPGPTLVCTRGKWMIVRVTNAMDDVDEPTSIHWHGIEQNFSPFFDGPESVTQCPIINGTSMVYRFQLLQSGTYWYHSHHTYQYTDGAWGFLIVRNSPMEVWDQLYTDEALISINDWYHDSARNITEALLRDLTIPRVDSSLINGRGTYPCSNITNGTPCNTTLQAPAIIRVKRNRTYRLRILNSASAGFYNFSIDSHKMTVIETDGVDTILSREVDVIQVWTAQRYSVLVSMDQDEDSYWIRIVGGGFSFSPNNAESNLGLAILRYVSSSDDVTDGKRRKRQSFRSGFPARRWNPNAIHSRPPIQPINWNDVVSKGGIEIPATSELVKNFAKPLPSIRSVQNAIEERIINEASRINFPTTEAIDPTTAILLDDMECRPFDNGTGTGGASPTYDQLIEISVDVCPTDEEPGLFCMNGLTFRPQGNQGLPTIFEVINTQIASNWSVPVYTPELGKVIRVVLNNHHVGEEPHPWHLHGHTIWVLGVGEVNAGDFDPDRDELNFNGVRRDTTFNQDASWVVFQFVTDNPGTWFFHCHLSWHLSGGLGMTFIEAADVMQKVYKRPPLQAIETCARVGVSVF